MKSKQLRFGAGFRVSITSKDAQAAEMTLSAGQTEGGPNNNHSGASQWLFVKQGVGLAIINKKKHLLMAGTLLLIEKGENHEIINTGRYSLKTLNFYIPPSYHADGTELPRGKAKKP